MKEMLSQSDTINNKEKKDVLKTFWQETSKE